MRESLPDFGPLAARMNDQRTERDGPDDSMQQHLGRRYSGDYLEVNRQQAPQAVCDQAGGDSMASVIR